MEYLDCSLITGIPLPTYLSCLKEKFNILGVDKDKIKLTGLTQVPNDSDKIGNQKNKA
jgi:hypothetical protein